MSTQSKRVLPFFCQALPPDPLPLLTSQMSLGQPVESATILANEESPPPRPHSRKNTHHAVISAASASVILTSSSSVAMSHQGAPIHPGYDEPGLATGSTIMGLATTRLELTKVQMVPYPPNVKSTLTHFCLLYSKLPAGADTEFVAAHRFHL